MEFTLIEISGVRGSRSFPARAFAIADGYQRSLSGAPLKPVKNFPGVAEAKIPALACLTQLAETEIGTDD